MPTQEERLQRLYDYTKFHIGVYLLAAGAVVSILGSPKADAFLGGFTNQPFWLGAAIIAMAAAGLAGGIVASSCASAPDFYTVWEKPIGPWFKPDLMAGKYWAGCEHTAFWASLILLGLAALL